MDEEAVKLIRYQAGYRAAARFITTINEMIDTLLSI
jgi:flagellar hook-associated protein 1 FlgK